MGLNQDLSNAVDLFNKYKGVVKLVSHYDTDGLTSLAILIEALKRQKIKFSASTVRQLNFKILKEIKSEGYHCIIFSDLGSGSLKDINKLFNEELIIILDHHIIDGETKFLHFNPLKYEISSSDISGAGMSYLFVKALNENNKDLAHLAVIGAVGDVQDVNGFKGINKTILEDAVQSDKIEIRRGLRLFGSQTRPLHKILQFSTDPYIPGITGNESAAISFLTSLGIELKEDGKWKKLIHLNEDEMKKLVTAIILKRIGNEENPEDVLGSIYLLKDEPEESPTRDVREFSTLLNCCGRLNKPSLGIGVCLGNKFMREKAINLLNDYRMELIKGLDWFYRHRNTSHVIEYNNFVIINAEDNIRDTLVSTVSSIISKSNIYKEGTKILALAHTLDGNIKISFRISGFDDEVDLRNYLSQIMSEINQDEFGGHRLACGGLIPLEKESIFIKTAIEKLKSS